MRDLEQNFVSNLLQTLNVGLPSFVFRRWWMQYTEREQTKYVLKQDFIPIALLVIVALILEVVRNLFLTFHLHVGS